MWRFWMLIHYKIVNYAGDANGLFCVACNWLIYSDVLPLK